MSQKDNIINLQKEFDEKAKKIEERNQSVIGGRFNEIMEMLDFFRENCQTPRDFPHIFYYLCAYIFKFYDL